MARLNVALLRALDNNANPVSGGKLYVYRAGTTTPVTTYSDAGLTTVHAHPVIADTFGFFTEIYLPAGSYKVSVTDARDVTLDEADNIDVANVIQVYSSRDVSSATEAATLPEGTVVTIAGREYRVAAAKTGNASAMSDLGVDGLVPAGEADLAHFGVAYDAVYTDGRWTGTDATAALQRAADWMAVSKAPVYVTGEAVVTHRDGRNFNAVTVGTWCHWIGRGKGLIGFDFNPAEAVSGNGDKNFTLFGVSDSETADEDTVIARETFRMTKMVIRGLFAANPRGRRQHILRLMGYEEVIVEDCNIQDVSGNFSRSDFNGRWVTKGGYYKNIASGVVRSRYTSQIKVVDAVFENIHDDVIDPHSGEPTIDQPAEPVRFDLYVAGCSFLHCKGINVIGGVSVRIIGNAFYWCLGPISVWARSSDSDEGQGVNHGVFIIGNEILDPLRNLDYTGSDDNTPLIPTAFLSNTNQAILLGGADPEAASGEVAPRAWNSTNGNFNLPYSPFANLKAGAMWARDQQNGTSGHASAFFLVCNNTIRRTRPNATFAFNQGFGPIASKYGATTISLDSNSYSEEGITILPRMINFHVCGNQVSGIKRPIYFEDDQSDKAYINGLVSDNILEDFYYGVSRAFRNKVHWDVTFRGNKLSGDPFWRSPSRVAGGGWSDPTGLSYDYTIGIHLVGVRGCSVEMNEFREVHTPWFFSNPNANNWAMDCHFRGNKCFGYFVAEGWDAGNLGIGYVYFSHQDECSWLETYTDQTDAKYGQMVEQKQPVLNSATMPSVNAFYLRGHIVNKRNAIESDGKMQIGWKCESTGRTDDFKALYATTSPLGGAPAVNDQSDIAILKSEMDRAQKDISEQKRQLADFRKHVDERNRERQWMQTKYLTVALTLLGGVAIILGALIWKYIVTNVGVGP